jgi:hypothetical protein
VERALGQGLRRARGDYQAPPDRRRRRAAATRRPWPKHGRGAGAVHGSGREGWRGFWARLASAGGPKRRARPSKVKTSFSNFHFQ